VLPLVGCSSLTGTGSKGYISGDGQVVVFDAADRDAPITASGTTLDGDSFDLADVRGKPVVVNFWWSLCAPCRSEAPDLIAAADQLGDRATFIGVDIRDTSPDLGLRFQDEFGVPYPSIYDSDGVVALAFAGYIRQGSIPSTVILDAQGRVAATFSGAIPSVRTLVDAVAEAAGDG